MADTEKFEITLTKKQAALVRECVAQGDYASVDEVVAEALTAIGLAAETELPAPDTLKRLLQQATDDQRPPVPMAEAFARVRNHMAASKTAGPTKRAG